MYEHKAQPLLSRAAFLKRLARSLALTIAILLVSLGIGMLGYRLLEGLSWIDALLNASMLLGGMGPVDRLRTDAGKVFGALYALYAGIVFLVAAGVLIAPVLHRFAHRFHLEEEKRER